MVSSLSKPLKMQPPESTKQQPPEHEAHPGWFNDNIVYS
jgi:hypothetical protein